jgi:hypothetical protein
VMEMALTGSIKKNYLIIVNEIGYKLSRRSIRDVILLPKDETDAIEKEITQTKEEIKDLKNRKTKLSEFNLGYQYHDKDEVQRNPHLKTEDTKQFSDFTELLDTIFS